VNVFLTEPRRGGFAPWLAALLFLPGVQAAGLSPLAEWQSSAGVLFEQLFETAPSKWSTTLGFDYARLAAYPGASNYKELSAPLIDVRYRDRWFASTVEGLGVTVPSPATVRAGAAITYDFGRRADQGPHHDLPGVDAAPELKLFVEKALTPVLIRLDLRRALGGYDGWVADLSMYAALPIGKSVVLFIGPSLTAADGRYMRSYYGVSAAVASMAGGPVFQPDSGLESATLGATLYWAINDHWGIEGYGAQDRLLGDATHSPVTESQSHLGGGFAVAYQL